MRHMMRLLWRTDIFGTIHLDDNTRLVKRRDSTMRYTLPRQARALSAQGEYEHGVAAGLKSSAAAVKLLVAS
jgi:hypothetical protein